MEIYAYGIIDSNSKISDSINGLEGVGIYTIPYRDIGIVVSENEQIQDITREHILKHEEVVEKLMESFTVLPVRFLTQFSQKEDVLLMMKEYYNDFRENLDRLRNKIEFGIKVIWPANTIKQRIINTYTKSNTNMAISDSSLAKSFVKKKFEKYKIDKEFEEEANRCIIVVDDYFNRIAIEKKLQKLASEDLLLNAAYLVEKERQSEFKQAFEQLKSAPSDLNYLFSGPWPPYNFIVLTKKTNMFNSESLFQELVNKGEV